MQSLTKNIKKGLVVSALLFTGLQYADEIDDLSFFNGEKTVNHGLFEGLRETLAHGFNSFTDSYNNMLTTLNNSSDSDAQQEELLSESEISNSDSGFSEVEQQENEKSLQSGLQSISAENDSVQVSWLRKNVKVLGFGALALVTVGAITYVLYKNGTLNKLADVVKKRPYVSAGIASAAAIVSGYIAFKCYEPYMFRV